MLIVELIVKEKKKWVERVEEIMKKLGIPKFPEE